MTHLCLSSAPLGEDLEGLVLGWPLGLGAQPKRGGGQEVLDPSAAGAFWGPWVHVRGAQVIGALTRDAFPCSGPSNIQLCVAERTEPPACTGAQIPVAKRHLACFLHSSNRVGRDHPSVPEPLLVRLHSSAPGEHPAWGEHFSLGQLPCLPAVHRRWDTVLPPPLPRGCPSPGLTCWTVGELAVRPGWGHSGPERRSWPCM